MAMRRRRSFRGRKAFSFRRNPLRTHVVKEPRWNFSNFRFGSQFQPGPASTVQSQFLVMNPRLLLELVDPGFPGDVPGTVQNSIMSPGGVKVGGIEWDTSFHLLVPQGSGTLVAYLECKENLIVQEVQDDGLPNDLPDWQTSWRPISTSDTPGAVPSDGAFDIVRILRRRTTFIPYGENAFSIDNDVMFHFNPNCQTASHQGWGHQSKRLRSFITDDQQLVFDVSVFRPDTAVVQPPIVGWLCTGTLYWKLGR